MDRNKKAIRDLKAKGEAIRNPGGQCDQCGKQLKEEIFSKKIGGTEKRFCSRDCIKLFEVNISAQRIIQKERMENDINFLNREIDFKKEQIQSGNIVETRMINQLPGQPAIIIEGYKEGTKPSYILENEIESRMQRIKEIKRQMDNITEMEEEDAK